MEEDVVDVVLPALSSAVPVAVAAVGLGVSTFTVQYVVTDTLAGAGPVEPDAIPYVPVAEQPLAAMPDAVTVGYFGSSVQVNATPTSLMYQPLLPSVPLTTDHVIAGAVLSIRIGPNA